MKHLSVFFAFLVFSTLSLTAGHAQSRDTMQEVIDYDSIAELNAKLRMQDVRELSSTETAEQILELIRFLSTLSYEETYSIENVAHAHALEMFCLKYAYLHDVARGTVALCAPQFSSYFDEISRELETSLCNQNMALQYRKFTYNQSLIQTRLQKLGQELINLLPHQEVRAYLIEHYDELEALCATLPKATQNTLVSVLALNYPLLRTSTLSTVHQHAGGHHALDPHHSDLFVCLENKILTRYIKNDTWTPAPSDPNITITGITSNAHITLGSHGTKCCIQDIDTHKKATVCLIDITNGQGTAVPFVTPGLLASRDGCTRVVYDETSADICAYHNNETHMYEIKELENYRITDVRMNDAGTIIVVTLQHKQSPNQTCYRLCTRYVYKHGIDEYVLWNEKDFEMASPVTYQVRETAVDAHQLIFSDNSALCLQSKEPVVLTNSTIPKLPLHAALTTKSDLLLSIAENKTLQLHQHHQGKWALPAHDTDTLGTCTDAAECTAAHVSSKDMLTQIFAIDDHVPVVLVRACIRPGDTNPCYIKVPLRQIERTPGSKPRELTLNENGSLITFAETEIANEDRIIPGSSYVLSESNLPMDVPAAAFVAAQLAEKLAAHTGGIVLQQPIVPASAHATVHCIVEKLPTEYRRLVTDS